MVPIFWVTLYVNYSVLLLYTSSFYNIRVFLACSVITREWCNAALLIFLHGTVEAACPFLRYGSSADGRVRWSSSSGSFVWPTSSLPSWSRKCRRLCCGLPFLIDSHPHKEGIRCTDVQCVVKCYHRSTPCHPFRVVHAKHWVCYVNPPLIFVNQKRFLSGHMLSTSACVYMLLSNTTTLPFLGQ